MKSKQAYGLMLANACQGRISGAGLCSQSWILIAHCLIRTNLGRVLALHHIVAHVAISIMILRYLVPVSEVSPSCKTER